MLASSSIIILGFILTGLFICLVKGHPFDFFDASIDDFDNCLNQNNITLDEYEKFESFDNLENVLNETVEWKYKCNIHCQLDRQSMKWLNQQGEMDLQLMNISNTETGDAITKCMANGKVEQCSYSYKLVLCAYKNNFPVIDYEAWQLNDEEIEEWAKNWQEEEENNNNNEMEEQANAKLLVS